MTYIAVDLLDPEQCRDKLTHLKEVTHIFYAALLNRPTWAELVQPNLATLVNVVDAVEPIAENLQHISLMQGYKVYGAHLGPFKPRQKKVMAATCPPNLTWTDSNV